MEQFSNNTFREIWTMLSDVPVNDDLEIEESFLGYPAGTDCSEIWHDLEDYYNITLGEEQFKT